MLKLIVTLENRFEAKFQNQQMSVIFKIEYK